MSVVTAVIIVTVIGIIGAAILVVASQFMKVEVDERITLVADVLPGANCGACGRAGCSDYATAIVEEGDPPNLCVPGGSATAAAIVAIVGGEGGVVAERKAIVGCQGTNEHREKKYDYTGISSCTAAAALHGGDTACPYGCLGYGDCKVACKFGAIEIVNGIARVYGSKCTGCGACLAACPKRVIWIREASGKPVVMCANHQRGAITRKSCTAGCISCGKCQKACPTDAIHVVDNVARIDLEKCISCGECVHVCPVRAITMPKAPGADLAYSS